MRKVGAVVDSVLYSKVRQYQLDQAVKGRKLKIGQVIIELLERGLDIDSVKSSPRADDGNHQASTPEATLAGHGSTA